MEDTRVVCAALRHRRTGKVLCGARHYDQIMLQFIENGEYRDAEQGFIDNYGNFLTRSEAYEIAERNNQFNGREPPRIKGKLFSEDLY